MMRPQKRFAAHVEADTFYSAWIAKVREALALNGMQPGDLAQLLGDPNSARLRRRLRGESRFEAFEMVRISHGLGIPLDPTGVAAPVLELVVAQPVTGDFDGDAYIHFVVTTETEIDEHRSPRRDAVAHIITIDVPLPALAAYPMLAALRIFVLEGGGGRQDNNFDFDQMQVERSILFEDLARIAELQARADTVEIWGPTPLFSLLTHLRQLYERRAICRAQTEDILDTLRTFVTDLREAARSGQKSAGGRFELHVHPQLGPPMDIVVETDTYCLTVHTLRRPHYAVSYSRATARLFRELFEERCKESQPARNVAPYFYRSYTDSMFAAIEEVGVTLQ